MNQNPKIAQNFRIMLTIIKPQDSSHMEGLDHLFLLPERALTMDATRLQKDLAGLDFDARLLHEAPMGNIWLSGSRPSSTTKGGTIHWFAYVGPDPPEYEEDAKARLKSLKDRENDERQKKLEELKAQALAAQRFKEKKEIERRQRIDELRHKEDSRRQQVEERKKAINDAERDRLESILKRNQEREARIEAKRRNERHSLVFAFGSSTPRMLEPTDSVGSFWGYRKATSTQNIPNSAQPLTRRQSERELDGGSKKRATSAGGLERSVEDMRMSTSMYEIFNWGQGSVPSDNPISSFSVPGSTSNIGTPSQIPAGCASGYVGRRRTDLMPTIPSRDTTLTPARKSFTRSPGRAYSMSRLDQLSKPRKRPSELPSLAETTSPPSFRPLNRPQQSSVSRSMSHLVVSKVGQQPQRPLRKSDSRSMHQLSAAAPLSVPRTTRATQLRQQKLASTYHEAPSRPSSSLSQQSTSSVTSSVTMRTQPLAAPRRPRPVSIAVTGISSTIKNGTTDNKKTESKPPLPKTRKSSLVKSTEKLKKKSITSPTEGSPKSLVSPVNSATTHSPIENVNVVKEITKETDGQQLLVETGEQVIISTEDVAGVAAKVTEQAVHDVVVETTTTTTTTNKEETTVKESDVIVAKESAEIVAKESNEIVAKESTEIVTKESTEVEEQPKPDEALPVTAAAKEEVKIVEVIQPVEKQVEITKPSEETIEVTDAKEKTSEVESNAKEEVNDALVDMSASMTKVRINTEEEAKAALAERRRLAREEAERQAELERKRIEEEARLEFERQQREEEQQRILIEQMRAAEQERLEEAIREAKKREEEERLRREEENRMKLLKEEAERKAREEAERQKAELQERLKNEEKEREVRRKRVEAIMLRTRGKTNSTTTSQTEEKNEENKPEALNGSKVEMSENGHKNGKEIVTVDNIIPVDSLKNANTVNNVDNLSTDDTLNSNNSWQRNTQTDLLM